MRTHKGSQLKDTAKRVWKFIWDDDSAWSWIANVILAFILIKFLVYPLLGLFLGTQLPVVAVISESMSHTPTQLCDQTSLFTGECIDYDKTIYEICAKEQTSKKKLNFDNYWFVCGDWYDDRGINKEEFKEFKLNNGFEKGDVIVLGKADPDKLKEGDILVFLSNLDSTKSRPYPIIHRIIDITQTSEGKIFATKGDHNGFQIITTTFNEKEIFESQVLGKGVARIPLIGYVKLWFVDLLDLVGLV
jgi:hypothetical protein